MTCQEWEIRISAYHDDALDPERRRRVEAHLAACGACRAHSEAMATLGPMLHAAMTRAEAPENLFRDVMMRLPEQATPPRRPQPVLRPPRGWLSFGLAPVGIALWLLVAGPASQTSRPVTGTPHAPEMAAAPTGGPTETPRVSPPVSVKGGPNGGKRKSNGRPTTGSPSGTTPPKVAPSEHRPELDGLRKLQQRRPPRFQDRYAGRSGWRVASDRPDERRVGARGRSRGSYRPRRPRRARPLLATNPTPTRQTPLSSTSRAPILDPESWISVVDYVLPQAAPETTAGEGTEFVLSAAETYQVARTSYEY